MLTHSLKKSFGLSSSNPSPFCSSSLSHLFLLLFLLPRHHTKNVYVFAAGTELEVGRGKGGGEGRNPCLALPFFLPPKEVEEEKKGKLASANLSSPLFSFLLFLPEDPSQRFCHTTAADQPLEKGPGGTTCSPSLPTVGINQRFSITHLQRTCSLFGKHACPHL